MPQSRHLCHWRQVNSKRIESTVVITINSFSQSQPWNRRMGSSSCLTNQLQSRVVVEFNDRTRKGWSDSSERRSLHHLQMFLSSSLFNVIVIDVDDVTIDVNVNLLEVPAAEFRIHEARKMNQSWGGEQKSEGDTNQTRKQTTGREKFWCPTGVPLFRRSFIVSWFFSVENRLVSLFTLFSPPSWMSSHYTRMMMMIVSDSGKCYSRRPLPSSS